MKIFLIYFFVAFISISCSSTVKYAANKAIRHKQVSNTEGEMVGYASYYGSKFHGKKTANGEIFDMYGKTAAHRSIEFGTMIEVTNIENNKSVVVKVNDRGPFVSGRILDLSYRAAQELDMIANGVAKVKIRILKPGENE